LPGVAMKSNGFSAWACPALSNETASTAAVSPPEFPNRKIILRMDGAKTAPLALYALIMAVMQVAIFESKFRDHKSASGI
jgi:hypothetical protein